MSCFITCGANAYLISGDTSVFVSIFLQFFLGFDYRKERLIQIYLTFKNYVLLEVLQYCKHL